MLKTLSGAAAGAVHVKLAVEDGTPGNLGLLVFPQGPDARRILLHPKHKTQQSQQDWTVSDEHVGLGRHFGCCFSWQSGVTCGTCP